MDMTGNVALVTGGASGLGKATVARLADMGAAVVVVDLPGSDGAEVAAATGGGARFVAADVTDPDAVAAAVGSAVETGPLRVAVCCAGIGPPRRLLGRDGVHPLDDFRAVVEVNLVGTFNVVRLAASAMAELDPVDGERGVLVTTASVAAYDGQVGQVAYAASKAGVAGMTLPLARDLASAQIRVMSIAPGLFDTPLLAGLPEEARESLAGQVPHPRRLGLPSEYADLVAHVVGNPMLNGEVIRLDGAIRMAPR
jgi:NAD(P)-dependent dehydrogenase (short-subunit alcohol dehydrogenase family)